MQTSTPEAPAQQKWLTWNRVVLCALVLGAVLVPASNLMVDPYDVFRTDSKNLGVTPNQRYRHVKRMLDPSRPIDVLLMGDSVMGINDPRLLVDVFPRQAVYNASFFMASVVDLKQLLSVYLNSPTQRPRLIIVGLDPALFVDKGNVASPQMRMPPEMSGEKPVEFFKGMLFAASAFHSVNKLIETSKATPSLRFDPTHGHYELPEQNLRIAQNHSRFVEDKFGPKVIHPSFAPIVQRELNALRDIESVVKPSGTQLLWLLQPTSSAMRTAIGPEKHDQLVRRIHATVTSPLVDLSTLNGVSNNFMHWYDSRHYLPSTGHEIIKIALKQRDPSSNDSALPLKNDRESGS